MQVVLETEEPGNPRSLFRVSVDGKVVAGALTAAQRIYAGARPEQIRHAPGLLAISLFRPTPTGREVAAQYGKPQIFFIPANQ